jgi:Dehydroquinase class II
MIQASASAEKRETAMPKILLVQGANLTFLGRREPEIYGSTTPAELDAMLQRHARDHGYQLAIFYTNIEGEAINRVYQAVDEGSVAKFAFGLDVQHVTQLSSYSFSVANCDGNRTLQRSLPVCSSTVPPGVPNNIGLSSQISCVTAKARSDCASRSTPLANAAGVGALGGWRTR